MRGFGTSGLPWTRILRVFPSGILPIAEMTALPHCPSVAIRGILFSVVVAMVTAVMLPFELAVAPLLSVVVLMVRAASSFSRVELMLRGGFLEVTGPQILLGVVVPVEGLLFP